MHRCNPSQSKLHVKSDSNTTSIKGGVGLFLKGVGGEQKALGESIWFYKHMQVIPAMSFRKRSPKRTFFLWRWQCLMSPWLHCTVPLIIVSAHLNFLPLHRYRNLYRNWSHISAISFFNLAPNKYLFLLVPLAEWHLINNEYCSRVFSSIKLYKRQIQQFNLLLLQAV